jgi:hypothetical protein
MTIPLPLSKPVASATLVAHRCFEERLVLRKGGENVAELFRTLISTLATAFLIASVAHGQVRQGTEPERAAHDQSESEHGPQSLVGTWKLLWARAFDDAGYELPLPFGPQPMGMAVFDAERMIVTVADGRTSLPAGAPLRAFVSYCGDYEFDGTKLVTHADGASNPAMLKDQVRRIEFESRDRKVAAPISGLVGQNVGLRLAWERVR